jgi:hypothetical protein
VASNGWQEWWRWKWKVMRWKRGLGVEDVEGLGWGREINGRDGLYQFETVEW